MELTKSHHLNYGDSNYVNDKEVKKALSTMPVETIKRKMKDFKYL